MRGCKAWVAAALVLAVVGIGGWVYHGVFGGPDFRCAALTPLPTLEHTADPISSIALTMDGRWLARGGEDQMVAVFDTATGTRQWQYRRHDGTVTALAFAITKEGTRLVSGATDRKVNVWDTATGESRDPLRGHNASVLSLSASPDGRWIAAGLENGQLLVWDLLDQAPLPRSQRKHDGAITAVAFSADSTRLVTASQDQKAIWWDTATLEGEVHRGLSVNERLVSVALSDDGSRIAAGLDRGDVLVWERPNPQPRRRLTGARTAVRAVTFASEGRLLVGVGEDLDVRLWDVADGSLLSTVRAYAARAPLLAFAPTGRVLAAGRRDGSIAAWRCDDRTGTP